MICMYSTYSEKEIGCMSLGNDDGRFVIGEMLFPLYLATYQPTTDRDQVIACCRRSLLLLPR